MTPNLVVTRSTRASGPNKFDFFSNFIYNIYIEKRKKEKINKLLTDKCSTSTVYKVGRLEILRRGRYEAVNSTPLARESHDSQAWTSADEVSL